MTIYILIALAAALFIGGTWFLLKGLQNAREDLKVVPISDFKEIKDLQKKEPFVVGRTPQANLSQHLVEENTKRGAPSAYDAPLLIKDLQNKIEQLRTENGRLTNALKRELDSKDTSTLSVIERDKLHQKEGQLALAHGRIEKLSSDYNHIKKQLDEKNTVYESIQARLNDKNSEYAKLAGQQVNSSKELYEEIQKLKTENQNLQQKSQELSFKIQQKQEAQEIANEQKNLVIVFEKQIADLKNNNSAWQLKLDEGIGKWRKENESLVRCLKEEEEKSKELTAAFKSLNKKYDEAVNVHSRSADDQIGILGEQLSKIMNERDDYKKKAEIREAELTKLRELNNHLLEKEKILQYELTKSRAQTLGLERICEDFKSILEK